MAKKQRTSHRYINVYEWEQRYGGPEEGGWYYEWLTLVSSKRVLCRRKGEYGWRPLKKGLLDRIRANTGKFGKYHYEGGTAAYVEAVKGQSASTRRPHYE